MDSLFYYIKGGVMADSFYEDMFGYYDEYFFDEEEYEDYPQEFYPEYADWFWEDEGEEVNDNFEW